MYEYSAQVIKVIDGDTLWLEVDLGFDVRRKDSFRLYGVDTPELPTPEGVAAREFLIEELTKGELRITTIKDRREKYGRYLAVLWIDGENINVRLIEAGHAQPYTIPSAEWPDGVQRPA